MSGQQLSKSYTSAELTSMPGIESINFSLTSTGGYSENRGGASAKQLRISIARTRGKYIM
jgi:hypothetical protein